MALLYAGRSKRSAPQSTLWRHERHTEIATMESTEILRQEHRIIEVVLIGLTDIADRAASSQSVQADRARKALEILRNFADRCHHAKEEHQLFRLMERHGMAHGSGPLAVMLREHELGRSHVRAMVEALPKASAGDPQAQSAFAEQARSYVDLLREHIRKEDNVLYPMAEQMLDAEEDRQLVAAFEVIERDEMGEGAHQKYHEWAHELAEPR
jgi:hemerythrin-like domain-containing protein